MTKLAGILAIEVMRMTQFAKLCLRLLVENERERGVE